MDIKEFFRTYYNYWYPDLVKIIPPRIIHLYTRIGLIVFVIFMFLVIYPFPNREYYKSEIIGTVEQIEREPKNWNIKIDSNWYFVQSPALKFLEIQDKIVKEPGSWIFTIYDSLGMVVYQDSLKDLTFKLLENRNP